MRYKMTRVDDYATAMADIQDCITKDGICGGIRQSTFRDGMLCFGVEQQELSRTSLGRLRKKGYQIEPV